MKLDKNYFKSTNKKEFTRKLLLILWENQYFIILSLIFFASILFSNLYINKFDYIIDSNKNLVFSAIHFNHGSLIDNLVKNNLYQGEFLDRTFVIQKMPVLPLLIYCLSIISHNFYFIIIAKNLIFFSILVFFLRLFNLSKNHKNNNLYIFFLVYFVPYNMFVTLNFEYGDCLISILLPCLYLVLSSNNNLKYLYASLLLFFLYLTKNSLLIICILLPVFIIIFENNEKFKFQKYLLIIASVLSMMLWGTFSYIKTDRFAIGSDSLSINSMGMNVALNKDFIKFFPEKSVDLIFYKIKVPNYLKNEWEINDHFKKKNKEYLSNNINLKEYIYTFPKKLKFIFFNIRKDSAHPNDKGEFDNSIRLSTVINKIIINFSIILVFINITKKILRKNFDIKSELLFLLLFFSYILPFVLAWATSKHLVPLTIISYFYIINNFLEKKFINLNMARK